MKKMKIQWRIVQCLKMKFKTNMYTARLETILNFDLKIQNFVSITTHSVFAYSFMIMRSLRGYKLLVDLSNHLNYSVFFGQNTISVLPNKCLLSKLTFG